MKTEKRISQISYKPKTNTWSLNQKNNKYLTTGPLTACFQITRKCNLNCIYCCEPDTNNTELGINNIIQIINSLYDAGTQLVRLTGGEPLLFEHIFKIIDLINDSGMNVAIDTNGTLLTSSIIQKIQKKIVFCGISLDGLPYIHNKFRSEYSKARNSISLLHKNRIPIIISMVLTEQNLQDIFHVLEIAQEVNAISVRIVPMMKRGRGKNLQLKNEPDNFIKSISAKISDHKKHTNISTKVILINWKNVGKGSVIMIKPDGNMVGTPGENDVSEEIQIGNILHSSISDIWKKYKYSENHIKKCLEETVEDI